MDDGAVIDLKRVKIVLDFFFWISLTENLK